MRRAGILLLALAASASQASAEARTLRFTRSSTSEITTQAVWKDRVSEAPEEVWTAQAGPFIVTILRDEARIFDPFVEVYEGPVCGDLATQSIDLETRTWTACGRAVVLPVGQGDE